MRDTSTIVREGFDALGESYLVWQLAVDQDPRLPYLERFMSELPDGARVLDLGCGPGVAATARLARRFDVTGVDISEVQLELARARIPKARFVQGDLCELDFPAGSFDGITAFFVLAHTPRDEHEALLRRIAGWLSPGGLLLASFPAVARDDLVREWGGVAMYSSSHDAETTRSLLRRSGLELVVDDVAILRQSRGAPAYLWVIGKKSSGRDGAPS